MENGKSAKRARQRPNQHFRFLDSGGRHQHPTETGCHRSKDEAKTVLLDLNPQFAQLTLGRVEVLQWKNRDCQPSGGQLYYPTDYVAGKR
jgi:hypothetical protein